jgi:hypothetical protein
MAAAAALSSAMISSSVGGGQYVKHTPALKRLREPSKERGSSFAEAEGNCVL